MKKIIALVLTAAMMFTIAGCGNTATEESSAPTSTAEDTWVQTGSIDEAAEGADCGGFEIPESIEFNDIEFIGMTYSYLDKVAQAAYEAGAMQVYVRKAKGIYGGPITDRDIENEFDATWTIDVDGQSVDCYGFDENEGAIVALWTVDDLTYAVTSQGLGGEEVPMPEELVKYMVENVK